MCAKHRQQAIPLRRRGIVASRKVRLYSGLGYAADGAEDWNPGLRSSGHTKWRYLAAIDWCRCRGFGCLEAESHRSSASYALWPNVIGRPGSSLSASQPQPTHPGQPRPCVSRSQPADGYQTPYPSWGRVGLERVSRSPPKNGCLFGRRKLDRPC